MLIVQFPDETIRYGIYHGTSDICFDGLVETPNVFGENESSIQKLQYPVKEEVQPVDVFTFYGGGFYWKGFASLNVYDGPGDPWKADGGITDGVPDWVKALDLE